jgi:hypothetical protein
MFQWCLQYLVKWEGYGVEGNTWEYAENVDNAPEKVAAFHRHNPAAPRHIRALTFGSIPFRPISLMTPTSSQCFSGGGVIVRGTPSVSVASTNARATSVTSANPSMPVEHCHCPTSETATDHCSYSHRLAVKPHHHCLSSLTPLPHRRYTGTP